MPHEVLNAKHHAKRPTIVANAGQPGAVTIATNMAGRGTDIKLGDGVVEVGGLFVLGTERHEARRVDNQLRGRSGRQGDPGASQFVISLEDDLLRIFGGERIHRLMDRLGVDETTPIEHSLISRSVESAQKKVEEQNFQIRKRVLEYDDVMNKQREVIYGQRQRILGGDDLREDVLEHHRADPSRRKWPHSPASPASPRSGTWRRCSSLLTNFFPTTLTVENLGDRQELDAETLADMVVEDAMADLRGAGRQRFGAEAMREMESWVLLRTIDAKWRDHLYEMDYLREGIGLRALAQRDPLIEYKNEGFNMFQEMMESIQADFVRYLYHLEIVREEEPAQPVAARQLAYSGGGDSGLAQNFAGRAARRPAAGGWPTVRREAYDAASRPPARSWPPERRVQGAGRNDPCPCGSGKKYKKCWWRLGGERAPGRS